MVFDAGAYGSEVKSILALDGAGQRLMPLAAGRCSSKEALARLKKSSPKGLFAGAQSPEGALSGLYLYFSCLDESHTISQDILSVEGSFWHGILHRQEPDAGNASYWFRRVGAHPVFPALREAAAGIAARHSTSGLSVPPLWDALAFIDICGNARRTPGSSLETAALEIQRAEWQLLFDYCARRERASR
ncbi:MAG: hypothetical protein ACRD8O_22900 [Bryobacteraceae bacterium]